MHFHSKNLSCKEKKRFIILLHVHPNVAARVDGECLYYLRQVYNFGFAAKGVLVYENIPYFSTMRRKGKGHKARQ